MKRASTDLFDLIQSLTTNEKAYFKRYAGMHKASDNGYLKLFEAIAEQSEYCEESVKEKLKNEKLVGYFSRAKKYLYDKVLESMRLYHADRDVQNMLWRKYEDAKFLYSRRQFKMSMRLVNKIKKEAEEAECWFVYAEALRLEVSLTEKADDMEKRIEVWESTFEETLKKARNMIHFKLVNKLIGNTWNSNPPKIAKSKFFRFYDEYLNESEEKLKASPIESNIYYARCMGIYHKLFNDFDESYEQMEKAVRLFEANPLLLKKKLLLYFYTLEVLTTLNCERFEQEKAKNSLQKVQYYFFGKHSICPKDDFLKAQIYPHHYYNRLLYCFKFALHPEGLKEISKSQKVLKTYQYLMSDTSSMLLSQMYILFFIIHEDWEKALHWINYTLSKNSKAHKFSYISAQMWQLIIHVELQNYRLLESLLRNTIRSWKKEKVFGDYLQELTKMVQQKSHQIYPDFWSDLVNLVLKYSDNEGYRGVDTMYVFAISRIESRSIKEVRKELTIEAKNDFLKERQKMSQW